MVEVDDGKEYVLLSRAGLFLVALYTRVHTYNNRLADSRAEEESSELAERRKLKVESLVDGDGGLVFSSVMMVIIMGRMQLLTRGE